MGRNVTPTQITLTCTPLGAVIIEAFEVAQYQTAGFDKLGITGSYNIAATMPEGTTEAQRHVMMKNLLADRFAMKSHRETRDGAAYELTVEKSGHKLREATPDGPESNMPATAAASNSAGNKRDADGFPSLTAIPGQINYTFLPGKARVLGNAAPLSKLLDLIEGVAFLNGPITDHTGLTGNYDFRLDFLGPEFQMVIPDGTVRPSTATDFFPPIPSALSKQLGLHLERKKLPVDVLMLDSISLKPKENE